MSREYFDALFPTTSQKTLAWLIIFFNAAVSTAWVGWLIIFSPLFFVSNLSKSQSTCTSPFKVFLQVSKPIVNCRRLPICLGCAILTQSLAYHARASWMPYPTCCSTLVLYCHVSLVRALIGSIGNGRGSRLNCLARVWLARNYYQTMFIVIVYFGLFRAVSICSFITVIMCTFRKLSSRAVVPSWYRLLIWWVALAHVC